MTERWIGTRTTIHHLEQAAAEQRRREQDWNESVFSVRKDAGAKVCYFGVPTF